MTLTHRARTTGPAYRPTIETPDRMLGKPPLTSGPLKGVTIEPTPKVEEYWKGLGWEPQTGMPLIETLERLGLQDLEKDLYSSKQGKGGNKE